MTVEAAMTLPVFFASLCFLIVLGQMIITEAAIFHAVTQTAMFCAKQESVLQGDSAGNGNQESGVSFGKKVEASIVFHRFLVNSEAHSLYVFGGKKGIIVSIEEKQETVSVKAGYILRVPVPFFRYYHMKRSICVHQRKFTGYVLHQGEEGCGEEGVVYVAQYGSVYHTDPYCSHIYIHISDADKIEKILHSSHYRCCDKCLKADEKVSQLYITKYGDCYHSSLSCSGLKRTVKAVKKSDVKNMRMCSKCGGHH